MPRPANSDLRERRRCRPRRMVVVFMRAPRFGRVKSRLAADIGSLAAWQFYRRTSRRLLRRLERDPTWSLVIAWAEPLPEPGAPRRAADFWQGPGDIGERMQRCLQMAGPGSVVLLGADIPSVRARHIRQAFAVLRAAPLVFGPARDGGFWLVGARNSERLPRPLFAAEVRWSSPNTLADVTRSLKQPFALTEELADVDYGADLPSPGSLTGFPGR